jgi:hypothetical protein
MKGMWGCLICKKLKNSSLEKKCSICGAKREPNRFGFSLNDVFYLCHVNTSRALPLVTISRLRPPESTTTVTLPVVRESLLDAVKESIRLLDTSQNQYDSTSSGRACSDEDQIVVQNKGLDLYHRVMDGAKDLSGLDGSVKHKDLKYVQSMKKEKDAMDKIVKDTILSRVEDPLSKDLNTCEDNMSEWKAKVSCALCAVSFPPAQLLGNISNQSILKWMKEHGVSVDSKECKKMALQAYETARMCLFCTQFFDQNYSDTFDVELSANEDFRSRRKNEKKHNKAISKEDKFIEKMNEKLSIAELKNKKDVLGMRVSTHGGTNDEVYSCTIVLC